MLILPATGVLIKLFGFRKAAKICEGIGCQTPLRPAQPWQLAEAQDLAQLAAIAGARGPISATCLRQALVVRAWLRRRGLDARLKIGVKMPDGQLDAHAWVEVDGVALGQHRLNHAAFDSKDLGS
ncbi:MAG: lasso peptide biosynthesis B2 protein [Burkholderiaceae bacterium]